ncbi:MAG: GTP-binding protein [Segetibacter sp.]
MKLHLLSGFLGSGKTTAIQIATNHLLEKGVKAGVITNDQGTRLVDGDFFKSLKIPEEQVVNSCFCCNYNELDSKIESLIRTHNVDTIFAESVGSCTDVVATIFNPLLQFRPQLQVTVSTFADAVLLYSLLKENKCLFDEDVKYIYCKQLQEAGVIVVNKVDLISKAQLEELKQIMRENYREKIIHYQNSFDTNNIEKWLDLLNNSQPATALQSLKIDYDIYGSGEAKLAWLDQEVEINSVDNNAIENTVSLINSIFHKIKEYNYNIGNVKFLINGDIKVSFTSTTPMTYTLEVESPQAATATLLINARVQTTPETLSAIVADAIDEEERKSSCKIFVRSLSSFKPGYPKPTHRIPNSIDENNFLITQKFILSLCRAGAEVFRVSGIEELVSLYHKSAPEMEIILNTIPELGLVNAEEIKEINTIEPQLIYQTWVRGALGVAENGAIWLDRYSTNNRPFPFICEYLIIVLNVNMIVANMYQAYAKIKINKEGYGVFLPGLSNTADIEQSLVVDAHGAPNLIVYLIDPQFSEKEKPDKCGPDCLC